MKKPAGQVVRRKRKPSNRQIDTLRRFRRHRWDGVALEKYNPDAGELYADVSRQVLVAGSRGAETAFDVRYFEIAAGGNTSLEWHQHAHVVVALRGEGRVRLGRRWHRLGFLDVCYIRPGTAHQLRNTGDDPFGFLCVVDAQRDRGRAVRSLLRGWQPSRRKVRQKA